MSGPEPGPCGHDAPRHGHGLCRACYMRWRAAGGHWEDGRPAVPPPRPPGRPPVTLEQFEDFCRIRAGRWRVEAAGLRVGVRTRTAWALEARRLAMRPAQARAS